jgi:hypothetical protein
LGHTGYYRRFIRRYENITAPLENLLKKAEMFQWNPECDKAFEDPKGESQHNTDSDIPKLGK